MSSFAQASTNALPALAPPLPEMPPTFWEQHGSIVLIGGFIVLALAAIILWMLLKPAPPPVVPPETIAREALVKLQRQPENGKLLSEVSQTLRRYVIAALKLPSGEPTTTEFSAALAGSQKIGADLAQAVSSFLRDCDERKFSTATSGAPLNAAGRALEILNLVESETHRRDASAIRK